MLLGLLLASCAGPTTEPEVEVSPHERLDPAHPLGPTVTLVEPVAGFVVAEQDTVLATARVVGREITPRWWVNGAAVETCAASLTCELTALPTGSVEICVDAEGVDRSCAAGTVEPCTDTLWYPDTDADGFGDRAGGIASCAAPAGTVRDGGDCDDTNAAVHPDAAELCNGADDDCDTFVDNDATNAIVWYADADGDGHGVPGDAERACTPPPGRAALADDCDDTDDTVSPDGVEVCNGHDDDCDGLEDIDPADPRTWYEDADGDGFGDRAAAVFACAARAGTVADGTDCDDATAGVHPRAAETCNGRDDDCDTFVDEPASLDAPTWYADRDGDGYGDVIAPAVACSPPPGFVARAADCDDTDAYANPAGVESCDGNDDDCDGMIDEPDAVDAPRWYLDEDGDGWGIGSDAIVSCSTPRGRAAAAGDCDDALAAVHPDALEACNDRDDDCDGEMDQPGSLYESTWYRDVDGDGFGDPLNIRISCAAPRGWTLDATDCDDRDALVWPDAAETCDGVDDDCDGTIDEPDALDASVWYEDVDGDGYGNDGAWSIACDAPDGHAPDGADCDDADPTAWPGADERLDGVDDDCDGVTDELTGAWMVDLVANGGFELGDLTGWTLERGTCRVVETGDLDWISAYEGTHMFHGGVDATTDCVVSQEFDLVGLGLAPEDLDSGRAAVDAMAILAHEMNAPWSSMLSLYDRTMLRVFYVSDAGEELGSLRTLLSEDDGWAVNGVLGVLPEGTRALRIELEGRLRRGVDVDAVADAVSVSVSPIEPSNPAITKLPFLQDYRQDAMRMLWETDDNLCSHVVQWAPTGQPLTNVVTVVDTVEVDTAHYVHVAEIDGLEAGTEYDYRVGSGDTWSDTYTFRTAPVSGEPFKIGWVGDNESGTPTFEGLMQGMLDRDVDLYFSPGDVVWNGDEVDDWENEWFSPLETANFSQTHPVLFARGNHDEHHALSYAYSALPGDNEDWYSFSYGNLFFVVLDSDSLTDQELPQLSQMEFLEGALTSDEALLADFRIVVFHHAPYTAARHDNASEGYVSSHATWVPIFEDNNVDLVISGHFHSYQRGEHNGVTYLIVGGGGGYLDDRATGRYPFMSVVELTNHYAMMEVEGTTLTWTAYDEDEVEIDTFAMTAD